MDTVLNLWKYWAIGAAQGKYDVRSVITHEFGHWLVLQDLYPGNHPNGGCDEFMTFTMYYQMFTGNTTMRTLEWGDRWGKWYIYTSGNVPMAPSAVSDLPPGTSYGSIADLLPSFPSPANPEVWLPYRLFRETPVVIHIYDSRGALVRTLDPGLKSPGNYLTKERAAYWDGHNHLGERVASGVYFYTLETRNETHAGRIVIGK